MTSVLGHSAVSIMTQRATVQRDTQSGTNDWNLPDVPSFTAHIASQRCYAWIKTLRNVDDEGKTASVNVLMMIIPLGTDIIKGDRITTIKDRAGTEEYAGNYKVKNPPARNDTHLEIELEKIS